MDSGKNEYYCEYITKSGQRVGETIWAYTGIDARRIIEFFIYPLIKYLDESIKVQ